MVRKSAPLAQQAADEILSGIRSGKLADGDGLLPSEAELSRRFEVSRATIREALAKLEHAGIIIRRHGVGTFVAPPQPVIDAGLEELESLETLAERIAQGALPIDASREVAFFVAGDWHKPTRHADTMAIAMSRPLLESTIYRRVLANPRIQIKHAHNVVSISTDAQRQRVTGLVVHDRDGAPSVQTRLPADVVVDASGRQSQAPQWLQKLGYMPADELTVNTFVGYATRVYQKPADFAEEWKALYIRPTLKTGTRGGMIIPFEGDRWFVSLLGTGRDYPPIDEAGFMEFARSLPTPKLFEAIQHAEPLTGTSGYRRTDSRLRRYDQLPRYLEGLLVTGDAACILNPVHAQGITAAAIGSQALSDSLQTHFQHHPADDVSGLAAAFQQQQQQSLAGLWNMVVREDRRWPAATVRHITAVAPAFARQSMTLTRVTL